MILIKTVNIEIVFIKVTQVLKKDLIKTKQSFYAEPTQMTV